MASTTQSLGSPPPLGTSLQKVSTNPFRQESYLPTCTTQTHASNLLLRNGDLMCAWFGGSQEGIPDISIYVSWLPSGSTTWIASTKVSLDPTRSEQNPVLFQSPSGPIWLLYTSQDGGNQDTAIVKKQISNDGGRTWGPVETLFSEPGTFIRQPMLILPNGTWVIPIFKCRVEQGERWLGNDDISCVRASVDQGVTWTETEVPQSFGCVHMAIVALKSGKFMSFFRSRWADRIYTSVSDDGIKWDAPEASSLPNPNSGICAAVMESGRVILIYNQSSKEDSKERREGLYDDIGDSSDVRVNQSARNDGRAAYWGAPRARLSFAASDDEGRTWKSKVIEDGDGYCMTNNSEKKLNRELSYPSIAVEGDNVHVAFTYWRQTIKYVRLKEDYAD